MRHFSQYSDISVKCADKTLFYPCNSFLIFFNLFGSLGMHYERPGSLLAPKPKFALLRRGVIYFSVCNIFLNVLAPPVDTGVDRKRVKEVAGEDNRRDEPRQQQQQH